MTDKANQSASHRAINDGHECQQAILGGNVNVGNRAGNGNEAAQNKEQSSADADGYDGFYRKLLHNFYLHNLSISGKRQKYIRRIP